MLSTKPTWTNAALLSRHNKAYDSLACPSSFTSLVEKSERNPSRKVIISTPLRARLAASPSLSFLLSCHSIRMNECCWEVWGQRGLMRTWLSDNCHSAVTLTNQTQLLPSTLAANGSSNGGWAWNIPDKYFLWFCWEDFNVGHICASFIRELDFNSNSSKGERPFSNGKKKKKATSHSGAQQIKKTKMQLYLLSSGWCSCLSVGPE